MKTAGILTLFFLILSQSAYSEPLRKSGKRADFFAGYRKMAIKSPETDEMFPLALIYPSSTPSEQVKFGPFEMQLSVGGRMAKGNFPLVIISHGSGGTNWGYRSIALSLVNNGFAVGMPLHPKNNYQNNSAEGTISNWTDRPKHLSASIDAILANQEIAENIDNSKIAVIGHSAGGYSALAVAGGTADTSHIIELCTSTPQANEPFCGLVRENKLDKAVIRNRQDKRVKAIVMMAPVGVLFRSKNALDKVSIPALMLRAEKDLELTEPYEAEVIAKNYKDPRLLTYCTVPGAGHYSFITPFPEAMRSELGVVAEDPAGFDRNAFHKLLSSDVVTWLDQTLNPKHNRKFQPLSCRAPMAETGMGL